MRKTILATFFYPPASGGIENYLHELFSRLPEDKVFVLAKNQTTAQKFDAGEKYKIFRVPFETPLKYLKLSNLVFYHQIKKIVLENKIENLVLGHPLPLGLAALWLKKRLKIPYFTFAHGKDVMEIIGGAESRHVRTRRRGASVQYRALGKIFAEAEKIITTTNFLRQKLINVFNLPAEKFAVIPPGVDFEKFAASPHAGGQCGRVVGARRRGAPLRTHHAFTLLTVARLVKRKGHDLVIQALNDLHNEFPNLKYLIIGDGEEKENLINLTKHLGLEKQVIFKTKVTDAELPRYYQKASIFVMPSQNIKGDLEGFGLVFLEAAAAGLPIIATKSGGIPEAVIDGETGILIDINVWTRRRGAAITNAISDLLNHPEKSIQLGLTGQNRVRAEFNWNAQALKLRAILK